jgi:hypothetical protein
MKPVVLSIALVALVLAAVVALLGQPSARAAASQSVTLTFARFFDVGCNCFKARLAGRTSSTRAGEEIVILHEYCGRGPRSAGGATTREGGAWEAVIYPVSRPDFPTSESYRARWDGTVSDPVTFKGPLASVSGARVAGGRQRVTVVTPNVNPVTLKGRTVVLQRRVGNGWTRVASAPLAPHRARFYTFTATFSGVRRGWTVRALVAARAAAPCFTATASESWVS